MSSPTPRRERSLRLNLSDKEADELFFYLHRIVDALWEAYEDVLMEPYWSEEELQANEERLAAEMKRRQKAGEEPLFSERQIPW